MTDVARDMTVEAAPPLHRPGLTPPVLPAASLPQHVAVVMDGNGRWANARGLPRTEGHRVGEANMLDVAAGAIEIGVKELSVYAFSTENWRRSPGEVRFIICPQGPARPARCPQLLERQAALDRTHPAPVEVRPARAA